MKKISYLFFAFLNLSTLIAQPFIEWQRALGGSDWDIAKSVQQTTDGGYIVAGYSNSSDGDVLGNHGGRDCWLLKFSNNGALHWQKALGGSDWDSANSVQQTMDGGYIMAGYTYSFDGDVIDSLGGGDYWVVKLHETGEIQWQKTLGGSKGDGATCIRQTSDGGYIVLGDTESNDGDVTGNHGLSDFWVVKLDAIGLIQWQKTLGGAEDDFSSYIQQTSDGGYIMIGFTYSSDGDISDYHSFGDIWVVKMDATGGIQWQKALGGSHYDISGSIQQTSDGGYVLLGSTWSNDGDVAGTPGQVDYWVVKLSNSGVIQWQNLLGGSMGEYSEFIQQTSDGGYILTGYTQSNDGDISGNHGGTDFWVLKLSNQGQMEWQKTLGGTGTDFPFCVQQSSDGGYVVAGYTGSNDGDVTNFHDIFDFWVVKLSANLVNMEEPAFSPMHSLDIFPNPATSTISLQITSGESAIYVSILDAKGQKIIQQSILNGGNLDVSDLPNGLYSVMATTNTRAVFFNKLTIQN